QDARRAGTDGGEAPGDGRTGAATGSSGERARTAHPPAGTEGVMTSLRDAVALDTFVVTDQDHFARVDGEYGFEWQSNGTRARSVEHEGLSVGRHFPDAPQHFVR